MNGKYRANLNFRHNVYRSFKFSRDLFIYLFLYFYLLFLLPSSLVVWLSLKPFVLVGLGLKMLKGF